MTFFCIKHHIIFVKPLMYCFKTVSLIILDLFQIISESGGINVKNRVFVVPYHNLWQRITVHSAVINFCCCFLYHCVSRLVATNQNGHANDLNSRFCGVHFVLTNVKSLQENGCNWVPILHMSLFTLLLINIKCLSMHKQH